MSDTFVELAVDSPTVGRRRLTYRWPASLPRPAATGLVVWAPLRRQWKLSVVVALVEAAPAFATRDVYAVLEPAICVSDQQLAVAEWISRRYLCGLFDALRPMLPPAATQRAVIVWETADPPADDLPHALTDAQQQLADYIQAHGPVSLAAAASALGWRRGTPTTAAALEQLGVIRRTATVRQHAPRRRREIRLIAQPTPGRLTTAQAKAHAWLASAGSVGASTAEVRAATGVSPAVITALVRDGNVIAVPAAPGERPGRVLRHQPPPRLTIAQSAAWERLAPAVGAQRYAAMVLHGVTGSGKTELYLRAAAVALRQGRSSILLAPEIALATQFADRVSDRFPGQVAVLHSGLTDAERHEQWQLIRAGQRRIVVGPRSALFAPVERLGLVVLDEEHDAAYKQDAPPRFQARAVADLLARQAGAVLLLGSATPDVVTMYAAEQGLLQRLTLPDRVGASDDAAAAPLPLPEVELVDMRRELREGNASLFSRALQAAVARALVAGEQALLLLNRRGEATIVLCRDCGHVAMCPDCDIPMVYHRIGERMICHRCGKRQSPPSVCPACHSPKIRYLGAGTQRVEREVALHWPDARVARWDQDAISRHQSHADLLDRVRRHEVDIVVGTQMVAKGLDLPRVMTVGVVSADTMLHLPDFRSTERSFQLLAQVAGRAGRRAPGGVVVMQSYTTEHYCLQAAARHDYAAFYAEEIAFRRQHRYPPFARLAKFVYAHTSETTCQREAAELAELLIEAGERLGLDDLDVLGPAPCFARRVRGAYRWQVVIRAHSLTTVLEDILVKPGWSVDVDPTSLL